MIPWDSLVTAKRFCIHCNGVLGYNGRIRIMIIVMEEITGKVYIITCLISVTARKFYTGTF